MNKALQHYSCTGQIEFDSPESFLEYIKTYTQESVQNFVDKEDAYAGNNSK